MDERNLSNMSIDFHIYLQSLSVKTAEIHGYSCYQKKDKVESSSLSFFKISLKGKRRKNDRETKGQRQLSPFCRRQGLKFRKGICVSKSLRVAYWSAYRFKHIQQGIILRQRHNLGDGNYGDEKLLSYSFLLQS